MRYERRTTRYRTGCAGRMKRKIGRECDGIRPSSKGFLRDRYCLACKSFVHVLRFIPDGFERPEILEIAGRRIKNANRDVEKYRYRHVDSILWIRFSSFYAVEWMSRPRGVEKGDVLPRSPRFRKSSARTRTKRSRVSESDEDSLVSIRDLPSSSILASDPGLERLPSNAETMQQHPDARKSSGDVREQTQPLGRTAEDSGRQGSIDGPWILVALWFQCRYDRGSLDC